MKSDKSYELIGTVIATVLIIIIFLLVIDAVYGEKYNHSILDKSDTTVTLTYGKHTKSLPTSKSTIVVSPNNECIKSIDRTTETIVESCGTFTIVGK